MNFIFEDISILPKQRRKSNNNYKFKNCTACDRKDEAEFIHPILSVPICGSCNKSYNDYAILDNNNNNNNNNSSSSSSSSSSSNNNNNNANVNIDNERQNLCLWCNNSDGSRLFLCDTCTYTFCQRCVHRNFGKNAVNKLLNPNADWECYVCNPIEEMKLLMVDPNIKFFNMESLYSTITAENEYCHDNNLQLQAIERKKLINSLSYGEKKLASIFSDSITTSIISNLGISDYLLASNLQTLFILSKNLYMFLKTLNIFPGLFKTEFGYDNKCRLYKHQNISLAFMKNRENISKDFGSLRGGILADSPGLGKTVTSIALILSTAGTLPISPLQFWDQESLKEGWISNKNQLQRLLIPVRIKLAKLLTFQSNDLIINVLYKNLSPECVLQYFPTVEIFESDVNKSLEKICENDYFLLDMMKECFRIEMINFKENLDKKKRSFFTSIEGKRLKFEKKLLPSSATLIIVPGTLLEHWFEQLNRHINLLYLSRRRGSNSDNLGRGVVYLDGLGDIVDIMPPISSLKISDKFNMSVEEISQYLIVVTTFDRCKLEQVDNVKRNSFNNGNNSIFSQTQLFMKIRWLRVLVDEGHELGQYTKELSGKGMTSPATEFINQLATERRWILSGTPTKGTCTKTALNQILLLMKFLRHPEFGNGEVGVNNWNNKIMKPFLQQDQRGWNLLTTTLKSIMIRHTKKQLNLHEPIRSQVTLNPLPDLHDNTEDRDRWYDRAKALHIIKVMSDAKKKWKNDIKQSSRRHSYHNSMEISSPLLLSPSLSSKSNSLLLFGNLNNNNIDFRQPKAIVFSKNSADLQGTAHFLYLELGDKSICEHWGNFRSTELSRFRHSKRKYITCPLCGFENSVGNNSISHPSCGRTLLMVEYILDEIDIDENFRERELQWRSLGLNGIDRTRNYPGESGHAALGPGGSYRGQCLCCPEGCSINCSGYPNPLYGNTNPNLAIVAEDHILGYQPGRRWLQGQRVTVIPSDGEVEYLLNQSSSSSSSSSYVPNKDSNLPVLWQHGRLGGPAKIVMWQHCGGMRNRSFHGNRILGNCKIQIEQEDASILLLEEDGSTGLDLCFTTHIFLLDRIKDPALEDQIISRAHRMGATGPVKVELIQVNDIQDYETAYKVAIESNFDYSKKYSLS